MKPFMVSCSTEKARYDWAQSAARDNNYIFSDIGSNFEAYAKAFVTSPLNDSKILFYIIADGFSVARLTYFLDLVKDSPHIFVLSAPKKTFIKDAFLYKSLGDYKDEVIEAIKTLMSEPNRDSVRLALAKADASHIFHIMKFGAWRSPESMEAMLRINRYIYKSKNAYVLSLLAFALPNKAFAFGKFKKAEDKLQSNILKKFSQSYKHLNKSEVADLYLLYKQLHSVPKAVELSEEEQSYYGCSAKPEAQAPEAVKTLQDFI